MLRKLGTTRWTVLSLAFLGLSTAQASDSHVTLIEMGDLHGTLVPHPAVLTDRGLDAALSALAGRSPVPVDVEVHLRDRLPAPVESAAYFVAAEGLTNAAKHAAASRVAVTVEQRDDLVSVEVRDDGRGGANPNGGGLRGLADRVGAVGGRLIIDSRPGGPTAIRAELPCGS